MPKPNKLAERRPREVKPPFIPSYRRPLSERTHREFGRQPRLRNLAERRTPYLEMAVTAAAFVFLFYMVLGGA